MSIVYMPQGHNLESFLCSVAQGVAYSPVDCLVGESSAMSNLTITANESSSGALQTESLTMRQYSEMLESLQKEVMRKPTLDMSMSSAAASRSCANHSATRASDVEKMMPVTCGPQHGIASASFDPDDACLRTFQVCLLADISPPSLETWPKAGIVCDGAFYPQPSWQRRINEIGSGLLPTPAAHEPGWAVGGQVEIVDKDGNTPTHYNQRWYDKNTGRLVQKGITQVAQMWPTPTAFDANTIHRSPESAAKAFAGRATPGRKGGAPKNLREEVVKRKWRTPSASVIEPKSNVVKLTGRTPQEPQVGLADQVGGQLNPDWVEWLMGWPIGFTSLEPLRKDYFDDWQQRTQASAENLSGGNMRVMWWDNDPSETPYRPRPAEQRAGQHTDSLSELPQGDTRSQWHMGERSSIGGGMQDMWDGISAETESPVNTLRKSRLPEGEGETISRVAVGIKERVNRLKALGNGQVPIVAATAWNLLSKEIFA